MKTVRHLAWHDLRRCRALWLLWLAIIGLRHLTADAGPLLVAADRMPEGTLVTLAAAATFAELAAFWLAVSVVVHSDPLTDSRAFWRTRPIAAGELWLAKLVVLVTALLAVPLAIDTVRLLAHGAPPASCLAAALQSLLTRGTWLALAWLTASLTHLATAYLIAIAGGIGALVAILAAVASFASGRVRPADLEVLPPAPLPDDTTSYVVMTLLVLGGLVLVRWHYRHRRWPVTAAGGAGLAAITAVVAALPLSAIAKAEAPAPPAWTTDPAGTPALFEDPYVDMGDPFWMSRGLDRVVPLSGRVRLPAVPFGENVEVLVSRSRFLTADGRQVAGGAGRGGGGYVAPDERYRRLWKALPALWPDEDGAFAARGSRPEIAEATLANLRHDDASAMTGQTVAVETEAELRVTRTRVVASAPLVEGTLVESADHRVELVRVLRDGDRLSLLIRQIRFPRFRPVLVPEVSFILRDRASAAWTGAVLQREFPFEGLPGFASHIQRRRGPWGSPWGSHWQLICQVSVPWQGSWFQGLDARGLPRGVVIDVVESRYGGRAPRTIRADRVSVRSELERGPRTVSRP